MDIFSKKIMSNSLWMMLEKLVSMIGLIFVNSYMAKYVGPENFGKIIFASSLFIFIQSIAWFGAQNVYLKRMSENKISGMRLASANLNFRRALFFISSTILLVYLYLYNEFIVFLFALASFIASYYTISDIFSIYNNSQLKSVINALTNIFGLIIALLVRFFLVYYEFHLYYMVLPIILIVAIPYLLRWYIYKKENSLLISLTIKKSKKYNIYLINTGGALLISSISIVVYNQVSNIFLAQYSTYAELGIYNIAMTLGGAWAFINIALITSLFARIYAEKSEKKSIQLFILTHYIVVFVSFLVYLFLRITGAWWIEMLYGSKYLDAAKILGLIVIATALSNMGTINYRYMMKLGAYKYLSIKMLIISLLSIPVSYFLIIKYGLVGAAYCFVLIEFFSLTIGNYLFNKGEVFKMHLKLLQPYKLYLIFTRK
ncbi:MULTISPECIES: polysaccharide biosynthesis protein [unclassified Acinetobacter]|uniref:polysaccharide biosynthesis protein n=1 Tax=unclassified Acinetobacter TaxID=196816 RepID=UPI0029350B3F|nr:MULTISPECIES: polysaccharide biosynthesis protein [unclassified Acinetobacter]WOE30892.1 polysaccharide biosynthesis protein [Acinetobacter sp. SAAs470]WOE39087.1 polysaccharide biosynthesis protein [Acinetobacter sp. SAAs474]